MSENPQTVTARAPGKVNVYFRVGELQADGYHEVASLYQAVSLYEDVTATPSDTFSVSFSGPIDTSELACDASNLALKAAQLLAHRTGVTTGVHLDILKNVPIAGGMGGGSADAAATLVACNELWQTQLTKDELVLLGAELGADVPFALHGGTAVGTGRGDELSQALTTGSYHWVFALAETGLSTPEVYRTLDAQRQRIKPDIAPHASQPLVDTGVLQAVRLGDAFTLAEAMQNDLQSAAFELAPSLESLIQLGVQAGALAGIVSGSGPTVAFLVENRESASSLLKMLDALDVSAVYATGPVSGAKILHGQPSDHPSKLLESRPITVPIQLPKSSDQRRRS